jgi:hypothetical protein
MCDVLRHDDDLLRLNGTTTDPEIYCSYCQTTVGTLRNPNCQANANHLLCSDCNLKHGYNPCGVCGAEASHNMEIVPYHGNFSNKLNHHINNLQKKLGPQEEVEVPEMLNLNRQVYPSMPDHETMLFLSQMFRELYGGMKFYVLFECVT